MEVFPRVVPTYIATFLLNLEKGTTLVLHYLDDFCIIGANEEEVRRVTEE